MEPSVQPQRAQPTPGGLHRRIVESARGTITPASVLDMSDVDSMLIQRETRSPIFTSHAACRPLKRKPLVSDTTRHAISRASWQDATPHADMLYYEMRSESSVVSVPLYVELRVRRSVHFRRPLPCGLKEVITKSRCIGADKWPASEERLSHLEERKIFAALCN